MCIGWIASPLCLQPKRKHEGNQTAEPVDAPWKKMQAFVEQLFGSSMSFCLSDDLALYLVII